MVRIRSTRHPFATIRANALTVPLLCVIVTIAYVQLDVLLPNRDRIDLLQNEHDILSSSLFANDICTATRETSLSQTGSFKHIWETIDAITGKEEYKKSKISGGIFLYPRQTLMLYELIRQDIEREPSKRPYRVCETGFGSGHSAALFLSISPHVEVITFDKFDRPYQQPVLEMLKKEFPNRIQHITGNSCKTVPSFLQAKEFPGCDFLHGSSLCPTDNIDLAQNSKPGTILTSTAMNALSDKDVYFGPNAQWRKLREDRCIEDIVCFGEEDLILEQSFVFANENEVISHKFCFAQVTENCSRQEGNQTFDMKEVDAQRRISSDLLRNICYHNRILPPL